MDQSSDDTEQLPEQRDCEEAERDERRHAIYRHILNDATAFALPGPWRSIGSIACTTAWLLREPESLWSELTTCFPNEELRAAGVLKLDGDELAPSLKAAPVVALQDKHGQFFDLLTVEGCLSGQAACCACLQEAAMRQMLAKRATTVHLIASIEDMLLLRAFRLPAVTLSGLKPLDFPRISELSRSFTTDCNPRVLGMIESVLEQPAKPLTFALVAWSPARLSLAIPKTLIEVACEFAQVSEKLGIDFGVEVLRPSAQAFDQLQAIIERRFEPALARGFKSCFETRIRLKDFLRSATPPSPPPGVAVALGKLRELRTLPASEFNQSEYESARKALFAALEREIVRPLLEEDEATPARRALKLALAELTNILQHQQIRMNDEQSRGRFDPLAGKRILETIDRVLRLAAAIEDGGEGAGTSRRAGSRQKPRRKRP